MEGGDLQATARLYDVRMRPTRREKGILGGYTCRCVWRCWRSLQAKLPKPQDTMCGIVMGKAAHHSDNDRDHTNDCHPQQSVSRLCQCSRCHAYAPPPPPLERSQFTSCELKPADRSRDDGRPAVLLAMACMSAKACIYDRMHALPHVRLSAS